MPLTDSASLVRRAHEGGYAVVQFNTNGATYDLTRAVVEAAEEHRAPVILGAYEANLAYRGYAYAAMQMRHFAENAGVPVAVHLDHGMSADACQKAVDAGFTSVMIDGSGLPIGENIEQTRRVVELARPKGVSVEAEIGELQKLNPDGSMGEAKNLSDPEEARRISEELEIDMLAVGNRQRARVLQGRAGHPLRLAGKARRRLAGAAGVARQHGPGRRRNPPVRVDGHGEDEPGHAAADAVRGVHRAGAGRGQGGAPEPPVAARAGGQGPAQAAGRPRAGGHGFGREGGGMSEAGDDNLLVLQGGGPTPVLNASLYGVLAGACGGPGRLLGARRGVAGLLEGDWLDLTDLPPARLELLRTSPGAALGSTRRKLDKGELERVVDRLRERGVRRLVLIGGNGSLRGAEAIARAAERLGYELRVIGVPKTIDNDIPATDRCPGFASAARYVAQSVRDLGMDVRTLPQPVSIFETMGRGVGWLAGAAALGKLDADHAPHLIYLPERPFDLERFFGDVDRTVRRLGWCVAVVNEGIRDAAGRPVHEAANAAGRDAMGRAVPGGVAAFLAEGVTRVLRLRCRSEKPGLCGRNSMLHASEQDQHDAEQVGRVAARAAANGETGKMVSLRPLPESDCDLVPLSAAAGERPVPAEWLDDSDLGVTDAFLNYVRPLVGELIDYDVPFLQPGDAL